MLITRRGSVQFGPARGIGPLEITEKLFLPRPVINLVAGLNGFSAFYSNSSGGRPFGRLIAELTDSSFAGNEVMLNFRFGLRDWSGNWDDTYQGLIDFVALVEVSNDGDIGDAITLNGIEYNQAIQFFRTYLDLDSANQMPDNAIPLVADKATAIRIYADFNPPDGIKDADRWRGELEVTSSAGSIVLDELFGHLSPSRDTSESELTSGEVPHFLLPPEHARNDVKLRGRLTVDRPSGSIDAGWSPFFETSLEFSPKVNPMINLVGFNYLGDPDNILDGPATPPTQEEAAGLFELAAEIFPVAGVDFNSFQVEDIEGPGHLESFQHRIFDILRDIQGDAIDEFFYGIFGSDHDTFIAGGESAVLGGSAIPEERLAWSYAAFGQVTVAHELGHLLGRPHAPGSGDLEADDIDGNFPRYGGYPWGSIGQHGVSTSDTYSPIKSPSSYFDIMSYSTRRWISPYYYAAVSAVVSLPPQGDAPGQGVELLTAAESRRLVETLFLTVEIHRDRRVERIPSFHFPAPVKPDSRTTTPFHVEIADECRRPLVCRPLGGEPIGRTCWPRRLRCRIPYPANARWLLVFEGDHLLYDECIGDAPSLELDCDGDTDSLELRWRAKPTGNVEYLVQYQGSDGKWRGFGGRSTREQAFLPRAMGLFGVRVLATSGIATTIEQCRLVPPSGPSNFTISVYPVLTETRRSREVVAWTAKAHDSSGRTHINASFLWFDDEGHCLSSGRRLEAKRVPLEVREVRVVARNLSDASGQLARRFVVERRGGSAQLTDPISSRY